MHISLLLTFHWPNQGDGEIQSLHGPRKRGKLEMGRDTNFYTDCSSHHQTLGSLSLLHVKHAHSFPKVTNSETAPPQNIIDLKIQDLLVTLFLH